MNYDIGYTDLLTVCPQWEDLFVKETLKFEADHRAPRILDCGANIGLATLYFKKLYPQARVIAFEADPVIHTVLSTNLVRNGAADVETVNAALWTRTGGIEFWCEGADSGAVAGPASNLRGPTRLVPSLRLRDVLEKERVDLLKLDIEGAEQAVLADCEDAMANVRAMCLDLHEFDPLRRSAPSVLGLLERAGFAYTVGELNLLPWREPVAASGTPFQGRALCWALLIQAWRP
jgi:FkbM family methyltransferase